VFVNGQASEAAEVGTPGPASQLRVGGFHGYPFLRGALDEVRLSQGVRYRSAFTPPAAPFSVDGQTEALYHFDEGSGQSLTDASGRGRDLTLGMNADADSHRHPLPHRHAHADADSHRHPLPHACGGRPADAERDGCLRPAGEPARQSWRGI